MRTGLAKQFKQVLDAQAKRARQASERRDVGLPGPGADAEPPTEPPPRKRGHPGHHLPRER